MRSGDILANPMTGQSIRVIQTGAETGGALLDLESTWAPGGPPPPEHYHPRQSERFTIIDGRLRVRLEGREREVVTGDVLEIPAGVRHAMWNAADRPALARWETRPALDTGRLLGALFGFAERGEVNARGVPSLLDLAVLVPRHWNELRLTRPSPVVQWMVLGPLYPIGRMLGRGG
jgi:mannose-6-phosphate isomerase-like protein (cupin superfamily)